MAENREITDCDNDVLEIKSEPIECHSVEERENDYLGTIQPPTTDIGALNLWTSKATACLISQYKKYHSMVGQSLQIRSLREMFEMISVEMQKFGFYFSPQKCENKWRVLERKYKNLIFRERMKKPGRVKHYGHWEHKRALDEIFNERKQHMYLDENDYPPPPGSAKLIAVPSSKPSTPSSIPSQPINDPSKSNTLDTSSGGRNHDQHQNLTLLFERFITEVTKNFSVIERNMERRHKEEMAMRQSELEVQKKLLKLKEQKMELQRSQILSAAHVLEHSSQ